MKQPIYITAATHISPQQPLCEQWMDSPMQLPDMARAIDPEFKQWLNPMRSRRWDALLKRAVVTSMQVMRDSDVACPDAIITGTGMGCLGSTSAFLSALMREGETASQPTHFMQSTHNTIGSLIAMQVGCHGYNTTHAQDQLSCEVSLVDAVTLMQAGEAATVLVGTHDQLLDGQVQLLRRQGVTQPVGEVSVAMMLSTTCTDNAWCILQDIDMGRIDQLAARADALLQGVAPDAIVIDSSAPDAVALYPDVPCVDYHHLCGVTPAASAFGVYATAACVRHGSFPASMRVDGVNSPLSARRVLVVGNSDNRFSLILLSAL